MYNPRFYIFAVSKSIPIYYNISKNDDDPTRKFTFSSDVYSNAFCLELFGIFANRDTRRLTRMLSACFNAYPDRDFAVVAVPPTTPMTKCLTDMLKQFTVKSHNF